MPVLECHANDRKHSSIAPHVHGVAASCIRQHRGAAQAQVPEDVTMRSFEQRFTSWPARNPDDLLSCRPRGPGVCAPRRQSCVIL